MTRGGCRTSWLGWGRRLAPWLACVLFVVLAAEARGAAIDVRGTSSADNGVGGTSLTLVRPDGVSEGDQMVVQLTMLAGATVPAINAPSGWAQIVSTTSGSGAGRVLQRVYRKRAGGGETASYTWNFASARAASGTLFAFYGSDQVTSAGVAAGACAAPPCSASVSGSTGGAANWVTALFGLGAASAWTGPGGLTDYASAVASGGAASEGAAGVAGASSYTATATANGSGNWAAQLVRIRLDTVLPSTSMSNPGANLSGTVTLNGSAFDGGSGVASVSFQISPAGAGSWTELALDTAAPYSTSLDTTTVADGFYDFRTVATDWAGNVRTSTPVANRRVDNTAPSVTLTDPGPLLNGSLRLTATASDSGSGIASVRFEYAPAGTEAWTLIGSDGSAPYRTTFVTTALADGLYDLRALATDRAGNTQGSVVEERRVDNSGPILTLADPGAAIRLTVGLAASASDVAGVASVTFELSPAGAGSWSLISPDASEPYEAELDTTAQVDGLYDVRAVATDTLGNVSVATVSGRRIDNTPPAVTLDDPGAFLAGTVFLTPAADDGGGAGVVSVAFESSPAGDGDWTTIAIDTEVPWAAALDTGALTDGGYDLRAVATDGAGNVTVSAVIVDRVVDNTAPVTADDAPTGWQNAPVTVTLTATDAGSGVASTEFSLDGGPFVPGTSVLVAADGEHTLAYRSSDLAGNVELEKIVTVKVDTTAPTVSLDDPVTPLSGDVALLAEAADAGSGVVSVSFERARGGTGQWKVIGADTASPFEGLLDTGTLGDGRYDFRAVATDLAGNVAVSGLLTGLLVDNRAPATTDDAPSGWQNAPVTVTLTATDGGSGVAQTEYSLDGGSFLPGTSVLVGGDGEHTLVYRSTDRAGNVERTKTATVKIDATAPTVSLDDPGAFLASVSSLRASASDGSSGVASVEFQISPLGANAWRTIVTDTAAPWSAREPTGLRPGSYEVRAVATDGAGNTGVSQALAVEVRRPELGLRVRKAKTLVRDGRPYLSMQVTLSRRATLTGRLLSPARKVVDRWRATGRAGARRMVVELKFAPDFDGYCTLVVRAAAAGAKAETVQIRLRLHA